MAKITKIDTNQISTSSQAIKITGYGFPDESASASVYIGNTQLTTVSSSADTIIALLPTKSTYTGLAADVLKTKFIGGGGLRWTLYDLSGLASAPTCSAFRTLV